MKTVLSIQDLSCVGRCSLTVALPVLSAMGCRCSVLPTAVLSTHTGFPDPTVTSLTEKIVPISKHFGALGLTFDALTTGYLAGADQVDALLAALQAPLTELLIVDPAMGDHGKLYKGLDEAHVQAMSRLCEKADILLPNVTEAALLTGLPYRETADDAYLAALTQGLLEKFPATAVIITGVSGKGGTVGFVGADRQKTFSYQRQAIRRSFHGTGDLFAAVFTGSLLSGAAVYDAGVRAADFVWHCIDATPVSTPQGVDFETQLFRLIP